MARVLVIGDTHEPVCRAGYLDFCTDVGEKYRCNVVVHVGDLIDWHGISFHARQPECPGVRDEYRMAKARIRRWFKRFPNMKWCIGNHDERPARLAKSVNIPEFMLKPYNEIWGVPSWEYEFDFVIDETLYKHGTGLGGVHPAWNLMNKSKMSVVMGHCHSRAGTKWSVNRFHRFFCVDTGCGIDDRTFQFAYGKHLIERSVLACAVIDDGQPISIAMKCGAGETYHDSRFAIEKKTKIVSIGRFGKPKALEARKSEPVHLQKHKSSMHPVCNSKMWVLPEYRTLVKKDVTCGNCKKNKLMKD